MPFVDEFEFETLARDPQSWDEKPDINGFGMPDINMDGRVDNEDLMMLVMFHLRQQMDDDGTTLVQSMETADRASNSFVAAATDTETGNSVGGTYNPGTGEFHISFF